MCRVLVYLGPRIALRDLLYASDNSLIRQTHDPKMLRMLNLAGCGVLAWDPTSRLPEEPLAYHSVTLPVFDRNLFAMSDKIAATAVIAHVRGVPLSSQSTVGEQNLHPFRFPGVRLAMAHNGGLAHFERMRFALARHFRPEVGAHIRGNTDSEWVYALLLSQLTDPHALHTAEEIIAAVRRTLDIIRAVREEHDIHTSSSLNLFLSNGRCIVAVRYVLDFGCYELDDPAHVRETDLAYLSLWYTRGAEYGQRDGEWRMLAGSGGGGAVLIASEPLTRDVSTWLELPEYSALSASFRPDGGNLDLFSAEL